MRHETGGRTWHVQGTQYAACAAPPHVLVGPGQRTRVAAIGSQSALGPFARAASGWQGHRKVRNQSRKGATSCMERPRPPSLRPTHCEAVRACGVGKLRVRLCSHIGGARGVHHVLREPHPSGTTGRQTCVDGACATGVRGHSGSVPSRRAGHAAGRALTAGRRWRLPERTCRSQSCPHRSSQSTVPAARTTQGPAPRRQCSRGCARNLRA
jgi:hypothetical protein